MQFQLLKYIAVLSILIQIISCVQRDSSSIDDDFANSNQRRFLDNVQHQTILLGKNNKNNNQVHHIIATHSGSSNNKITKASPSKATTTTNKLHDINNEFIKERKRKRKEQRKHEIIKKIMAKEEAKNRVRSNDHHGDSSVRTNAHDSNIVMVSNNDKEDRDADIDNNHRAIIKIKSKTNRIKAKGKKRTAKRKRPPAKNMTTADKAFNNRMRDNKIRKQLFANDLENALKKDPHLKTDKKLITKYGKDIIKKFDTLMSNNEVVLRKTIYSSKVRLLFLAGLEGSGHHAWQAMMTECVNTTRCEPSHALNNIFMDEEFKYIRGMFAVNDYHVILRDCYNSYNEMVKLTKNRSDKLYLLGMDFTKHVGQLSYPSFNGQFKPLDRPDVHLLAMLAELAKLDLRIIVLQRNAYDLIVSVMRRKYSSPKILIDNAAALYQQLMMLDRKYYYCVDYDEMLAGLPVSKQHEIINHIHPKQLKGYETTMFNQFSKQKRPPLPQLTPLANATIKFYTQQLDMIFTKINRLCNYQDDPYTFNTAVSGSSGIQSFDMSSYIGDVWEWFINGINSYWNGR